MTVGKKAQGYFRFRGVEVERSFLGMSERPTFAHAREVAAAAVTPFVDGEVDRCSWPRPASSAPAARRWRCASSSRSSTPRPRSEGRATRTRTGSAAHRPHEDAAEAGYTEFEPDAAELLVDLAPRAAETEIFASLLEASASELTPRQRAMAAATENAGELIKKYSRIMNRARQDTITTEIRRSSAVPGTAGRGEGDEGGLVIETTV